MKRRMRIRLERNPISDWWTAYVTDYDGCETEVAHEAWRTQTWLIARRKRVEMEREAEGYERNSGT